ncbi:unnamed protein product [Clonostachys rhizophaga]|uniref:Major facilitator superfamily (MFS) profile domain-containing protein n=1 Tax=Clonostachys rhizophaga TaxID=160324 RepID=A0A9N9V6E4_9HYPO|nr:unnamed protein product [Clonostachys rhizophaga]
MEPIHDPAAETCPSNHQNILIQLGTKGKLNEGSPEESNESPLSSPSIDSDQQTYPEGGLQAWLVVFGAFCALGAVFGIINTSAVFESHLKEHQLSEYGESQIGWIFSLYLFLVFFIGIQVGPIFDTYGPRLLVLTGSLLMVASLMFLSISTEYYQIIMTYSVMGGIGGALLYCPAYGAIAHFFNAKRGLATGIATTAGGIGGIVFPLMLQPLLGKDGVGFAWSCRILGFVILFLCVIANLFIRSRLSSERRPRKCSVWPDFSILRHRGFACAAVGVFFTEWGLFVPLTYIISYAQSHGNGGIESSILLASLNAGSVLGRFLPGLLADYVGRFNVIIGTLSLCVITLLGMWLPAGNSKSLLFAFCTLFGFASGSNLGLIPVCIGQFCDCRNYGRYITVANMIASFGTLTSVPIGGAMLGLGGSTGWTGLILFSAIAYVMALSCFVCARVSSTGWKLWKRF